VHEQNGWIETLVAMERLHAHALSPDGTWVAACVLELDQDASAYVGAIYRVPVDGGTAQRLVSGRFDDRDPAFAADGTLTFTSNRGPDQTLDQEPQDDTPRQVWAWRGSDAERLTDEPLGVKAYQHARRAERMVVATPVLLGVPHEQQAEVAEDLKKGPSMIRYTSMPVRHWDHWLPEKSIHLVLYAGGERRDLTPERDERMTELEWDLSDDGRTLVLQHVHERADRLRMTGMAVVDVDRGSSRVLFDDADWDLHAPHLSPDGATLAVSADLRTEQDVPFDTVLLLALATGDVRDLTPGRQVSPRVRGWTRDGGSLIATADTRGHVPLYSIDAGTGELTRLTGEGTVHSVAIGEQRLVISASRFVHPPRLSVLDLSTPDAGPRELVLGEGSEPVEGVSIEHLEVAGADGVPVPYFVLTPADGGHGGGLVWIHGGPIGAWSDGWHWRWNPLAALHAGWTVAMPNPRGSTGYGRDFVQGIWGNVWGQACATDVLAVTEALAAREGIDPDRLVAMGGSFGGYMTNWLGTQTDRFAALVTHASLWDFRAFHGATDHPSWWAHMFGHEPWQQGEHLERYNPRAHLDGWTTPTLILHGEKDYRVPIAEALALFEALQHKGVPSELCVFPDENHWILKPRNIVAWYEAFLGFVERVVGGGEGDG